MTYYVSSGTLNLTKPKPKPEDTPVIRIFTDVIWTDVIWTYLTGCWRSSLNMMFIQLAKWNRYTLFLYHILSLYKQIVANYFLNLGVFLNLCSLTMDRAIWSRYMMVVSATIHSVLKCTIVGLVHSHSKRPRTRRVLFPLI